MWKEVDREDVVIHVGLSPLCCFDAGNDVVQSELLFLCVSLTMTFVAYVGLTSGDNLVFRIQLKRSGEFVGDIF